MARWGAAAAMDDRSWPSVTSEDVRALVADHSRHLRGPRQRNGGGGTVREPRAGEERLQRGGRVADAGEGHPLKGQVVGGLGVGDHSAEGAVLRLHPHDVGGYLRQLRVPEDDEVADRHQVGTDEGRLQAVEHPQEGVSSEVPRVQIWPVAQLGLKVPTGK